MRKIVLSILLVCLMSSAHAATWGDWLPWNWNLCKRRTKPQKMVVAEGPVSPASSTSFETLSPIYPHKKSLESKAHVARIPVQDWDEKDKETLVHTVLEMVERSKPGAKSVGTPKNAWGEEQLQHQAQLVTRYINSLFNDGWTQPQIMQAVLATLSTGGLGYEIRGEVRRWLDQTTFTASLREAGYRYFYFNSKGVDFKDNLNLGMTINLSLALAPYIPQRLAAFWDEFTSSLLRPCHRLLKDDNPLQHAKLRAFLKTIDPRFHEHRLETTYPLWAEITGNFVVLASAGVMGFIPAYALYKSNIGFDDTADLARTLPPFLGAFYGMDSFARFHVLKDKLLAAWFVGRHDDVAGERQALIDQINNLKKRVLTMDANALKGLQRQIHELKDLSTLFNGEYTPPVQTKASQTRWKKIYQKTTQAVPWVLGGGAAAFLAYLYYVQTEQSLADGYQYFDTGKPSLSDTLRFFGVRYDVFQQDTANIDIYNGNGTDWITQCFQSAVFTDGNAQDGGDFYFKHCPGVRSLYDVWTSNPGDFDYTEELAYIWYDFIDGIYAASAGINNTNNGGIGLTTNSYVLPTGGKVFANLFAAVTSGAAFGVAAYSGKKLVDRIWNSCCSRKPAQVLVGKEYVWVNGIVLTVAAIESLLRASPIAFTGWVNLAQTLDPGFLYTLLGVGTFAMATTYFENFDVAYTNIPRYTQKTWGFLKKGISRVTGLFGCPLEEADPTHTLRAENLLALDRLTGTLTSAQADVIRAIRKVTQPAHGEFA